jgi:hypothetical protein
MPWARSTAVQLLLQGGGLAVAVALPARAGRTHFLSCRGPLPGRQKLPTVLCRQAMREMIAQLRKLLGLEEPDVRRVYLLDGSSRELAHSGELVREYPPGRPWQKPRSGELASRALDQLPALKRTVRLHHVAIESRRNAVRLAGSGKRHSQAEACATVYL